MDSSVAPDEWLQLNEGRVLLTSAVRDMGVSEWKLRAMLQRGKLRLLRPGVVRVPPGKEERASEVYRAQIAGYLIDPRRRGGPEPLAGPAAAVWWGLPLLGAQSRPVYVAGSQERGRPQRAVTKRCGRVPAEQLTQLGGVALTTPARAALDVARLCGFRAGLVAADAALARRLAGADELVAVADSLAGTTGASFARAAASHADARADGPGESLSRGLMIEMRIPVPDLQVEIRLASGRIARLDFYWRDRHLCGEFDGLVKYSARNPSGQAPSDVVVAEKRREDELRKVTKGMLRWVWADLMRPAEFGKTLRSYLGV